MKTEDICPLCYHDESESGTCNRIDCELNPEVWKPIDGYQDYYEISNKGRVQSLARKVKRGIRTTALPTKLLAISTDKYGHKLVKLNKNGVGSNKRISILMKIHFPNQMTVK